MRKKVLIIAYTFPPASGVGGRRWAKFAKYLQQIGHDVQVIAAKSDLQEKESSWIADSEKLINKPLFINSGYHQYLGIKPRTVFHKIKYRWAKFITEFQVKGNYYDKSVFWKTNLLPVVESYIKNGYNNIIVTGAPFRVTYDLCSVKEKFKDINYIVDFRDPWVGNDTSYGFYSLSKKRQNYERHIQEIVVNSADHVISVNEQMTAEFNRLYGNTNNNLTINNGFDWVDIKSADFTAPQNNKLRLILCGTLYSKAIHIFEVFIGVLNKLKIENPEYYCLLKIDFYGDVPNTFYNLTKDMDAIKFNGFISLTQVYSQIGQSHACMLFMTDDMNHTLSTKFYEYIALQKTILVFTKKGKTGEFVKDNGLGYMLTPDNMYQEFIKIISDFQKNELLKNPNFNLDFCDVSKLVEKVDKLLI